MYNADNCAERVWVTVCVVLGAGQVCVPGGDKRRGEGFSKADQAHLWRDAKIPAVIIEFADALKVKNNIM